MPKFIEASPLNGPKVALVQSAKQMQSLMAGIGVYPDNKAYPRWSALSDAYGMTWEMEVDGSPYWVVGVNHQDNPIDVVGVIAHEATHVWQGWAEFLGEDKPSREFEAYSIQAILVQLLSQYTMPGKKRARGV